MDFEAFSHNYRVIAAVLLAVGVGVYAINAGYVRPQAILPGFEGMQHGLYGYQFSGSATTILGNTFPSHTGTCSYSWEGTPTPGSASVLAKTPDLFGLTCYTGQHSDTLVLDAQTNPIKSSSVFTTGQKVEYYVRVPNTTNQWQHVVGQVNIYTYTVGYSIQSGSEGRWDFKGDTAWYNLYANIFNQASTDPKNSSVTGKTWEAPLYGVVTDVKWQNQGSSGLDASVVGHPLSFYSSASATGQTLATLAGQQYTVGADVNKTLSSIYSPDSRLQRLVYYPITITSFKANPSIGFDCTLGCTYPSATITITLYTLQIGEYILTNPDKTGLGQRNQNCDGLGCLVQFISNPFNQLLLALAAVFGSILIAAVVLFVFAPGLVIAVLYFIRNRNKES